MGNVNELNRVGHVNFVAQLFELVVDIGGQNIVFFPFFACVLCVVDLSCKVYKLASGCTTVVFPRIFTVNSYIFQIVGVLSFMPIKL